MKAVQEVLPIQGAESDKEILIKHLSASVQAIAQATKVFDHPSKARELIESAIVVNREAIKLMCKMENVAEEFFIGKGLIILKVSSYLIKALDAYNDEYASVADASSYIANAHKLITKAMK